jgi:alanine dehydrogenase
VILLSAADVERLLDLDALLGALESAMADLSAGRASVPPRVAAEVAEHSANLFSMPCYAPSAGVLSAKLVTQFPHNRDRPSHQALVCCFDPTDGAPLALMDGGYLTEARTAVGSLLATRLLARPDSRTVAVVGTGSQARAHARVFGRAYDTVLLAGRDRAKTAHLAAELGVEPARSIADAVRAADIVCACTHAGAPVLEQAWLRPGAHLNSVGYHIGGRGEVDTATVAAARVAVESRAAALAAPPAGAVELAGLDPGRVVEIGELVTDPSRGRANDEQLTLYKSVGVAVQDCAAAAVVLRAAAASAAGSSFDV